MDKTFVNIPGRLVQQLNPMLSIWTQSKPTYLFESSELMAFGATLLEQLSREDLKHIPSGTSTKSFPYQFQGKACFLCKNDSNGHSIDPEPQKCCSKCTPPVPLDISQGQRILEHCGAHLLYDSSINRQHEHCGLRMRLTPMCVFHLKKSNGKPQIDWDKSTCLLKVSIRSCLAFCNLQHRGVPENQGEPSTNSLPPQAESAVGPVDMERPLPPAALSDDDDDDMPPPSLLLRHQRAVHQCIESEDEMDDDYHQPLPRNMLDSGKAQADGLQDKDISTPLTTPQEIEQELAEIGEELTLNAPIKAHNSHEPALLFLAETPDDGRELPQTVEEQIVPAKQMQRAAKLLNLGGCDTCQETITDAEKNDRSLVAECSKKGCET
ncbi:hypothetical protein MVEN_00848200 [Mycena venus]|uniref:Uncharacterized protein n=1 Tax=Mycena venus TaxID=2733690 RepID=A0A8H6YGR8_9AGAR|nr:hypothetical protein MVEN_00848200 [Mycena venus]